MKCSTLITLFIGLLFSFQVSSESGAVVKNKPGTGVDMENLDVSDEDRYKSQTYIHAGKSKREEAEACAKLDKDQGTTGACKGRAEIKNMGMSPSMMGALSKAYSMIVGMLGGAGGGMKLKKVNVGKDGKATGDETGKKGYETDEDGEKKKTQEDYCKYIAIGTEIIAMVNQASGDKHLSNLPENQTSAQKDALYKVARSYEERSKNAKISGYGFTATAACYGIMMATAGIVIDWKIIAKAAGAGILGIYFLMESKDYKELAGETKKLADKLPGPGDCNPITQPNCYCTQPETQYDPNVCMPYLDPNRLAKKDGNIPVSCVDSKLRADPKCNCVKTDSCFNKTVFSQLKGTGYGQAFLGSSDAKKLNDLGNGTLTSATLSGLNSTGKNARVNRILKSMKNKANGLKRTSGLTRSQKSELDAMAGLGIPRSVGVALATAKSPKGTSRNLANFRRRGNYKKKSYKRAARNRVLRFGGGRGLKGKKRRKKAGNPFAKFGKRGKKKTTGKVLSYAALAAKKAPQINKQDTPIFEIISRRYKKSAFRRLSLD